MDEVFQHDNLQVEGVLEVLNAATRTVKIKSLTDGKKHDVAYCDECRQNLGMAWGEQMPCAFHLEGLLDAHGRKFFAICSMKFLGVDDFKLTQ